VGVLGGWPASNVVETRVERRKANDMACDLNIKTARLISDFRAVFKLVEFIEHELEKRIVARLGLIKVEALIALAGAYKNEIKRNLGPSRAGAVYSIGSRAAATAPDPSLA
jgi:hypothetical protein